MCCIEYRVVNGPTSSGPNPKYKLEPENQCEAQIMPEKKTKVKLDLRNLTMLRSYFDYIFVHLRQKARLRPEKARRFVNFKPEPDPKSQARLTTLIE